MDKEDKDGNVEKDDEVLNAEILGLKIAVVAGLIVTIVLAIVVVWMTVGLFDEEADVSLLIVILFRERRSG